MANGLGTAIVKSASIGHLSGCSFLLNGKRTQSSATMFVDGQKVADITEIECDL